MAGAGKRRAKNANRGGAHGQDTNNRSVEEAPSQAPPVVQPTPVVAEPSRAGYDGPNDPRGNDPRGRDSSRGRSAAPQSGYRAPSQPRGRPSSQSRQPSQPRQQSRAPASKPPSQSKPDDKFVLNRNVDFGGGAYDAIRGMPGQLMRRPGFGSQGMKVNIAVNSHLVEQWPTNDVYQYDIVINSGENKRGLIKAVWASDAVRNALNDPTFIFDGNRVGWSLIERPRELKINVDLDAEKGRLPNPKHPNDHRVRVVPASRIRLQSLRSYLDGRASFDKPVLECINFFDHLLRETPSKHLINLKRSYFARKAVGEPRVLLGGGIEAMKGIYQSVRAAEGNKLVVNADVSNSCFWEEARVDHVAYLMSGRGDMDAFVHDASFRQNGDREPPLMPYLKRLKRNRFFVKHRGANSVTSHTIQSLTDQNAQEYKIMTREKGKDGEEDVLKKMSIYDYYAEKYKVYLKFWQLPLLKTTKKDEVYPMELAFMCEGQRYPFKLNEQQTAKMITFAVTRPDIRRRHIQDGLAQLNWQQDPFLKSYGMRISPQMITTKARVLNVPQIQFGKSKTVVPKYGRWDLRGQAFFKPGDRLVSWGVCVLSGKQGGDHRYVPTDQQLNAFIQNFVKIYREHGGIVDNSQPKIVRNIVDTAEAITKTFNDAGNQAHKPPQIMLIILSNRNTEIYTRIKKSTDCRFGVMSQCVQGLQVQKNNAQYISNVLMKFNCKIGGTTSTIALPRLKKNPINEPTMIIGADVSHAAPGSSMASMAAITMSIDMTCSRYAAAVESNGHRVELISSTNIREMFTPLLAWWVSHIGNGRLPRHVYYFRDGVSEGQYTALLKQEVADLKKVMAGVSGGRKELEPKFTVVVAEKRHHIRFFPGPGAAMDRNGNPVPGTIVDRDVTHPFENDIYLCSHAAIQGTSRPTHYSMLLDEYGLVPDRFEQLLYDHCYQYQRSTTAVSLFPAVYYAHLAAARGISHEDKAEIDKIEARRKAKERHGAPDEDHKTTTESEYAKLLEWPRGSMIKYGMWYI